MANFLIGLFANLRFCSPRSTFVQLRFAKPSTSSKNPNQKGLGWLKSEFEVLLTSQYLCTASVCKAPKLIKIL